MKISIIIPAYNVEHFLGICLDSVLAQTYQDWEVLLIDDGSTDATPAICDEYGKRDARIRVWHKENEGLSDTRQFAIPFAAGEYVLCIDSDDCIHPAYLERAAAHAEGKENTIIWMGYTYVPEDFTDYAEAPGKEDMRMSRRVGSGKDAQEERGSESGAQERYGSESGVCRRLSPIRAIRCIDEDENTKTCDDGAEIDRVSACVVWGKLYPTAFFERVSFPKGVRLHEDQRVNHRLFALAEEIIYDPSPLYFYRTRGQSLIRKSWRKERLYIVECYLDRLDCVKAYADTEEGKRLIELVYRRLLIGIIRNYAQMREHVTGKERREQSRRLSARYRQLWKENLNIALPPKKKPVLWLFCVMPRLVAWLFRIRG